MVRDDSSWCLDGRLQGNVTGGGFVTTLCSFVTTTFASA